MHTGSFFSMSSLPLFFVLDVHHSNRSEAMSHCGFDFTGLMTRDIEHLLMYLLATCMSSLKKCLFRYSTDLEIRLFGFCYWVVWVLYIFDPLPDIWCANIFSFGKLPFYFAGIFLCCEEVFQFDIVPLVYFYFGFFTFDVRFKKSSTPILRRLPPVFSISSMVSSLVFKSVIYFELIFVYSVR